MVWYIHTGDTLMRNDKIPLDFYRTIRFEEKDSNMRLTECLMLCDDAEAPEYPGDSVYKYASLSISLKDIDRSLLSTVKGKDGKKYVKLSYEITLTPMSGMFQFAFEAGGKVYDSLEVKYF